MDLHHGVHKPGLRAELHGPYRAVPLRPSYQGLDDFCGLPVHEPRDGQCSSIWEQDHPDHEQVLL